MILNGVRALILRYFTNLIAFRVYYEKAVEDTPIMSAENIAARIWF